MADPICRAIRYDPSHSGFPLSLLLLALAHAGTVSGLNATLVRVTTADGLVHGYNERDADVWVCEGDGCPAVDWSEYGRDAWSVYLRAAETGEVLQLDLWVGEAAVSADGVRTVVGDVTGAFALVKGYSATLVRYGVGATPTGEVRATDLGWVETERGVVQRTWALDSTDEWSVYLVDPATGERCILDLYDERVYRDDGSARRILGALAMP